MLVRLRRIWVPDLNDLSGNEHPVSTLGVSHPRTTQTPNFHSRNFTTVEKMGKGKFPMTSPKRAKYRTMIPEIGSP